MTDVIAKQAQLAQEPGFQGRVKLALVAAAVAVQGEAVAPNSQRVFEKRQLHATAVLANPNAFVDRYAWAVASNSTVGSTIGSPVGISASTSASPSAVTTSVAHGLTVGDTVLISGHTTNTAINGTWVVATVPDTTHFTVPVPGSGTGGATGGAAKQPTDSDIQFVVNSVFNDFAGVIVQDT